MLAPGKHSTNYGLDNPKSRGIIPNRDISTRPEKGEQGMSLTGIQWEAAGNILIETVDNLELSLDDAWRQKEVDSCNP